MATKGLRIVVFDGRYFIYYRGYEGYPKVFGRAIVNGIPTDPEQYTGSLNTHRLPNCNLTS